MDHYFTFTQLLGVRDSNLPPHREVRLQRYRSVQKIMDLIEIAQKTRPKAFPFQIAYLDENDRK